MITRRALTLATGALALAAPAIARAQQPRAARRIGFIEVHAFGSEARIEAYLNGLRKGLAALGWIEGRTITIDARYARSETIAALTDELAALTAQLIASGVELIVAPGSLHVGAAARVTRSVPIIHGFHGDPLGLGTAASLARPGGNITGMAWWQDDLTSKILDILRYGFPKLMSVHVLHFGLQPAAVSSMRTLRANAARLGVRLVESEIGRDEEIEPAVAMTAREKLDAIFLPTTRLLTDRRLRLLAESAVRHKIPSIAQSRSATEAGILLSYGPDFVDLIRRAAAYVDRVLRGANPAELPVEMAERFPLLVNIPTMVALGVDFPIELAVRIDDIIE